MNLTIISHHTINFVDSAACSSLKTGGGAGESRLYIGQKTKLKEFQEMFEDVEYFFFKKMDLIKYLQDSSIEYLHPTQEYVHKSELPTILAQNKRNTNSINRDSVKIYFDIQYDSSRCYLTLRDESRSEYEYLRNICIPKLTRIRFTKILDKNNNTKFINIMPVFAKQYTEAELGDILREMYESEASPKKPAIYLFGFKFADYIIEKSLSIDKIVKSANIGDSYKTELSNAIELFKKLREKNIAINSSANIVWGDILSHAHIDGIVNNINYTPKYTLQQIFFGAPGTSKSTRIKNLIGNIEQHRVTFHPDTDYSSFVGCYKPTKDDDGSAITYDFVAQPFVKAYVSAWKKLYDVDETQKEVFLVIEEINRGNCAQIFGDLFQLLDRNDKGYSDYSIEPDSDLGKFLKKEFADSNVENTDIKNGKSMVLPPNLYIWATMNTSDQSLFPIDSAFKRRWEWKYTPIKDAKKNHLIKLSDRQYDWWEFVEAVNKRIEKVTESEDKQIGYWFAKPENGVSISAERFVSKVIFYLWNDVFKDYGNDSNSPFVIKTDDGKKIELRFKSFFNEDGNIDESVLIQFMWGLKLETKAAVETEPASDETTGQTEQAPEAAVEAPKAEETPSEENTTAAEVEDDVEIEDEDVEPESGNINDFFNN